VNILDDSNIEVTQMSIADLENIKDVLQSEFDDFWNYNIFKNELTNIFSKYVVAKQYNTIVGFAGMQIILDEATIMNIVTKATKRNSGIASKMLEKLIDIAKDCNLKSITLEVNENNTAAINLYKKYNFKQVGLRRKYYKNQDSAVLMTVELI